MFALNPPSPLRVDTSSSARPSSRPSSSLSSAQSPKRRKKRVGNQNNLRKTAHDNKLKAFTNENNNNNSENTTNTNTPNPPNSPTKPKQTTISIRPSSPLASSSSSSSSRPKQPSTPAGISTKSIHFRNLTPAPPGLSSLAPPPPGLSSPLSSQQKLFRTSLANRKEKRGEEEVEVEVVEGEGKVGGGGLDRHFLLRSGNLFSEENMRKMGEEGEEGEESLHFEVPRLLLGGEEVGEREGERKRLQVKGSKNRLFCSSIDLLSFSPNRHIPSPSSPFSASPFPSPSVPHPLQSPSLSSRLPPPHPQQQQQQQEEEEQEEDQEEDQEEQKFDLYGFTGDYLQKNLFETTPPHCPNKETWEKFQGNFTIFDGWASYHSSKLKDLAMEGIPNEHRAWAWCSFVQCENPAVFEREEEVFEELLRKKGREEAENQIRLDLDRTFTTHKLFMEAKGQEMLCKVLRAFAIHNPEVGYCQGMSYVAAVLLMYLPPPKAFSIFRHFLEDKGFNEYYHPTMHGLLRDSSLFNRLLSRQLPNLAHHFQTHHLDTLLFVTSWFLTFFTNLTRWSAVLLFFDFFFAEGKPALFRFALALLIQLEDELLKKKGIHELLPSVQHPPHHLLDPQQLSKIALSLPIEEIMKEVEREEEEEGKEKEEGEGGGERKRKREDEEEEKGEGGGWWERMWNSVVTPKRPKRTYDLREGGAVGGGGGGWGIPVTPSRRNVPARPHTCRAERVRDVKKVGGGGGRRREEGGRQKKQEADDELNLFSLSSLSSSSSSPPSSPSAPLLPGRGGEGEGGESPGTSFRALREFATPKRVPF